MSSTIKYKDKTYSLPSDCSLSVGNSCETKERRMTDSSKTSYAITTYHKPQVTTYSLSFPLYAYEHPDLIREIYNWESLTGKPVVFTYCNIPFGKLIITDFNVSFSLDAITGITQASVSLNLKDNVVLTRKAEKINTRLV